MLLSVLRFKFDMPYNLRGISYKLQLTDMGEIFFADTSSRVAASLDAGIADFAVTG